MGQPEIRPPGSEAEFSAYYQLRYEILRAPWGQPEGSERDELEPVAHHLMALGTDGHVCAVGRLHLVDAEVGQIRYMAVQPEYRGRGLGSRMLKALEDCARLLDCRTIRLNARESVVGFYLIHGYADQGPGPTMFGVIHHRALAKNLK